MTGYEWYEIIGAAVIGLGGGFLIYRDAYRRGYRLGVAAGMVFERQRRICPHGREVDDCPDCRH